MIRRTTTAVEEVRAVARHAAARPAGPGTGRRVTLYQVAERSGVSVAAASFALSGRPGVSETTRERVRSAAADLGWSPNPAARALSAARANAIGFATVRAPQSRRVDTYLVPLLSGMEREAALHDVALVLHLAEDEDELGTVYRRWRAGRHVDGVVMLNLVAGDPRLPAVAELDLPAVVLGGAASLSGVSTVTIDHHDITNQIVHYLWTLGHRRIARVAGVRQYLHTQERDREFRAVLADLPGGLAGYRVLHTDYSPAAGQAAVRRLLSLPDRPTAIVSDNDVMAAAALLVAAEMGVDVPGQLSVVGWDDSELCSLVRPAITALPQDPYAQGRSAVRVLLDQLDHGAPQHLQLPTGAIEVRQSTGPPRDEGGRLST